MMITIEESGMTFGPFLEEDCFHIEKSDIYRKLQNGLPIAEFLLIKPDKDLLLVVEAKSSSPNPSNKESGMKFDEYMEEISGKLFNAFTLGLSLYLERHVENLEEISASFRDIDFRSVKIILLLVIKGHKEEWLVPLNEALQKKLKSASKIWPLRVLVINDTMARRYNLIQTTV